MNLFLSLLIIIKSFYSSPAVSKHKNIDFSAFPHEWIILSEKADEKVIFIPCDALPRQITISINPNPKNHLELDEVYGMDAGVFDIKGGRWKDSMSCVIETIAIDTKQKTIFKIEFTKADMSTAIWSSSEDGFKQREYVWLKFKDNFKEEKESCD